MITVAYGTFNYFKKIYANNYDLVRDNVDLMRDNTDLMRDNADLMRENQKINLSMFQPIHVVQFETIQREFNQRYSYIVERCQLENQIELLNHQEGKHILKRYCGKNLTNQYCYECLDCFVNFQHSNKKLKHTKKTHLFCGDCFDKEKHKSHKYKKYLSTKESFCGCGCQLLIKEESFCQNHKGFRDLKQKLLPPDLKEEIISYFKELFYLLIDGQSDFLYSLRQEQITFSFQTTFQEKETQNYTQFNILLQLIIKQIKQLTDIDNQLIFYFIEIFQLSFDLPTRINTENVDVLELLHNKKLNHETTIMEYLIMTMSGLNYQNEMEFQKLANLLCQVDSNFLNFMGNILSKLYSFAIFKEVKSFNGIEKTFYFMNNIFNHFYQALQTSNPIEKDFIYEDGLIKVNQILKLLLKNKSDEIDSGLLLGLFTLQTQIYFFPVFLENYEKLNLYLQEVFNLLFGIFEQCVLSQSQQIILEIQNGYSQYEVLHLIENQQLILIEKIIKASHKITNQENKMRILNLIYSQYLESIDKIVLKGMENKEIFMGYLCQSATRLIISFIRFKQQQELTSRNLLITLVQVFKFKQQTQLKQFIKKLQSILDRNCLFNRIAYVQCNINENEKMQIRDQSFFQNTYFKTISSLSKFYDRFILSQQIISLISKENILYSEYQIQLKTLSLVNDGKMSLEVFDKCYYKSFQKIKQILFDSTPYINMMHSSCFESQSLVDEILDEVVKYNISFFQIKPQPINELKAKLQTIIPSESKVEQHLIKHGIYNETHLKKKLKEIKQEEISLFTFNFGRHFMSYSFDNILFNLQLRKNQLYQKGIINKLFKFQKLIIIKYFSDLKLFVLLLTFLVQIQNSIYKLERNYFEYFIIFYDVYSLQQEQYELFTTSQRKSLFKIKKLIRQKDINSSLKSIIINIQKQGQFYHNIQLMCHIKQTYQILNKYS